MPAAPHSSGVNMPQQPISPSFCSRPNGNFSSRSSSLTSGRTSVSINWRTVSRISLCWSESEKSIIDQTSTDASTRPSPASIVDPSDVHRRAGQPANRVSGIGQSEWRDCVGVKKYVDNHPRLSKMTAGLYSQCRGGNSQYQAIARHPDLFANVKCLCSPLAPSMSAIFQAFSELRGVAQYQELIDLELLKMGGLAVA